MNTIRGNYYVTARCNSIPPNHQHDRVNDELIAGLPHNSIPKVTGEPTFEDLNIIQRYLNTNAMSVSLYEGGGRHGHLGIILINDEYFALATDVFTAPENPGATPVHAENATAARTAEANRAHKEATRVYRTYNNVDKAFKKLIIDAFEYQFINALLDEVVGYVNRTSLDLLTHLLTYYAMIASTELTQNYERLKTPYDSNQPTESLFQQIQDARAFVIAGGQPMLVNVAYTLVFNTGVYPDDCRAWQVHPAAQKTLTNFKVHFAAAHREFLLTNQTAQQSEFHSANMMIEHHPYQGAADTIAQLAQAASSDRDMVATLTANAKLTLQLETFQAYVKKLKEDIVQLKLKIKPA
jgi:hypothetical protein